jgi:hypothetical protein
MTDPRLGRLEQFDPRSRAWPIRALLGARPPRSYTWRPRPVPLDQGREGSCVGMAWAHELAARPHVVRDVTEATALSLYRRAQQLDEWPGEGYSGTSVLAGVKAAREQGYYPEFRWAFGADDVIAAIGWAGPVVLGVPWYESMYDTDSEGFVVIGGRVVGGHAIMAHGVSVKGQFVTWQNSWGPGYGRNGLGRLRFADLARLLSEGGEACVSVRRR